MCVVCEIDNNIHKLSHVQKEEVLEFVLKLADENSGKS